jgi:[protein-PII] uridylyltransferase
MPEDPARGSSIAATLCYPPPGETRGCHVEPIMETITSPSLVDPNLLREAVAEPEPRQSAALDLRPVMQQRLVAGRDALRAYFEAGGSAEVVHHELARQMDGLLQGALDFADRRLYGRPNPTTGEELTLVAVGGYGRGELAPASDIDLLFLHPYKRTPLVEQMAEFLIYKLWDIGLKVGHATRGVAESIRLAQEDLSVRTALLEARYVWGSRALFDQLRAKYDREVIAGHTAEFLDAKLAERDERHRRVGDSRYLLEPNIKEGKGGLRDLHTLLWIGKFLFRIETIGDLIRHGVLNRQSLSTFLAAQRFLWTVRCHLHWLTGRAEERLTFDIQPEIARRMGYRDRPGSLGVERLMKRYYLVAKDVGALTRIICAALDEQQRRPPNFLVRRFGLGRRRINGFEIHAGRISLADARLFEREPIRMLELFHLAQERELDIHPQALSAVSQNLKLVDQKLREDREANRLFLDILCSRKEPHLALTRMNEGGLLGRFVPDFGRVVALMQQGLYHVYTVDEHTIRVIEVLWQIEQGKLADELPLATELMPKLLSRRELYLAALIHDLGKGRRSNHSIIGEEIAKRLCPRLGLPDDATETVAWLVRHHLIMSTTAFRRDTEDPKTIADFVATVQSPERLKLLLVLTAADIRAVGPNVWNGWKGQLLRELYHEAAAAMATGDPSGRRNERIGKAKFDVAEALASLPDRPWSRAEIAAYVDRHDPRYWLGFPTEQLVRHAQLLAAADAERRPLTLDFRTDSFRDRTELLLYAADHPGLFMKIGGALALSGASIVDAHIFTTQDGMALDVLGFQDADTRRAIADEARLARIARNIERALGGEIWLEKALKERRTLPARTDVFKVEPRVLIDNNASRTHSVIEINGRDRPGLLFDLARTLKDLGLVINSAHVTTYGERVVDVFYVKDVFGLKITQRAKMQRIQKGLSEALAAS